MVNCSNWFFPNIIDLQMLKQPFLPEINPTWSCCGTLFNVLPGLICWYIGKDLGVYVHGVVSVGRFLIMSHFFNRYRLSAFSWVTFGICCAWGPPALLCGSERTSRHKAGTIVGLSFLFPFSWGSQSHAAYCQFLKTAVSYILSRFLVAAGRRVNVGFVLPSWQEVGAP